MHRSNVVGHCHEDILQISDTIYHCEITLCPFAEPQGGQVSRAGHGEAALLLLLPCQLRPGHTAHFHI